MDSGGRTIGGVKLETIVYIGIAADIVLAVVVGVLLVWWRNNSKKRQEAKLQAARDAAADSRSDWATDGSVASRQVDRRSGQDHAHQRLASERMVSRSVRTEYTEVEADFGFLDEHQSGQSQTSGRVVSGPPPHVVGASESRMSFHDVVNSEGQGGGAYTVANDERVVHNPLSASRKAMNALEEEPTDEHQVAKSVYYTYNDPPSLQPSRDLHVDEAGVSSSQEYSQPLHSSSAHESRQEHTVVRESVTYVETRMEEDTDEHHVAKTVDYRAEVDEAGDPSPAEYLQPHHTSSAYEMEDEERYENGVVRESVVSVESMPASPPPPPPPPPPQQVDQGVIVHEELRTSTTNYYSTLDSHVKVVEKESDEVLVNDMSQWAKMNFGYEEPEKRYIIQLEECTEVM